MHLVKEARRLALKEIEKFGIPNLIQFELAESKVIDLCKKLGADRDIALTGYYLMDLKLGEAFAAKKIEEHIRRSLEAAKVFLARFNLEERKKEKILNCIEAHHGDVPFICKEAEICANADAYRFLHPRGFFSTLVFIGKELGFEHTLGLLKNKIEEKYRILSLEICKKELKGYYFQLKDLLEIALG